MQEKTERVGFRVRAALALAVAGAITTSGARFARAEGAADLIQQGVALRRKGDDEGALRRFQKAYELDRTPHAQGQMGLAEQALGRWVQAYEDLSQALVATSDSWIAKNATALRGALVAVEEHVGKLEILGGSPGAEVSVDGVARGALPLPSPLILPIGVVSIRLSAAGLVPVQRSTQIRARQVARESFDALAPVAPPPAEPAAVPVAASSPAAPEAHPVRAEPTPAPADRGGPSAARASAKWIAWGGAAVALVIGVYGYARQSSATSDFNGNCMIAPGGISVPQAGSSATADQCGSWKSRRDSGFALEVGGLIGFAAAAATGVVLWLTEPAPGATQTAWRGCAPAVGAGTLAAGCAWRF